MAGPVDSADRRLLVDVMCGGIVPYLRLCGHDTAYAGDRDLLEDAALLAVAEHEDRTIVTRDRALADRADRALCLESRDTDAQLRAIHAAGISLVPADRPRRCGNCNGLLQSQPPGRPTPPDVPDPGERRV